MNDDVMITAYVVIDDMMKHLGHQSHVLAQISDAEDLTVAVAAAKFFHSNHEAALGMVTQAGYLSGRFKLEQAVVGDRPGACSAQDSRAQIRIEVFARLEPPALVEASSAFARWVESTYGTK